MLAVPAVVAAVAVGVRAKVEAVVGGGVVVAVAPLESVCAF